MTIYRHFFSVCFRPSAETNTESASRNSINPPSLPENISFYLDWLASETKTLTFQGMGKSLKIELPIEEAFVPLRAKLTYPGTTGKLGRFNNEMNEFEAEVDLSSIFVKAADMGLRGLVLLGEPGAGKTTGARQLAWRLANRESLPEHLGLPVGMTPVFLRFRNLSQEALKKKGGLQQFLIDETHCEEAPNKLKSPGKDLWDGAGGGLLWILDGLDEISDQATRKKIPDGSIEL